MKPLLKLSIGSAILLLVSVVVMLLIPGGEARTIIVAQDGNGEYEVIQDAVDEADDGDTVRVWEGTYYENVDVEKRLTLIGNGSHETILDGNGTWSDRGIRLGRVSSAEVRNFNIKNFSVGIDLYGSVLCTIANNTMTGCGISVDGNTAGVWDSHSIDTSNTVNGKPVRYYRKENGLTVPLGAGQVIIAGCTSMIVENQNCSDLELGIYTGFSSSIIIQNNVCSSVNGEGGIQLTATSSSIVMNNTCIVTRGSGIVLWGSETCSISNNSADIELESSTNCTVVNNTMDRNGLLISGFELEEWNTHNIDDSNSVNGKPVRYMRNSVDSTVPDGAGQVILANCDRITVEGQNCSDVSVGVLVGYSSRIIIRNGTFLTERSNGATSGSESMHSTWGIYITDSDNCTVVNNTCTSNAGAGIEINNANHTLISNNNCSTANSMGMDILASSHCTIENNICENVTYGIWLQGFAPYSPSDHNRIVNNSCSFNVGVGLHLDNMHFCTVEMNNFSNSFIGISNWGSSNSIIAGNTCQRNWLGIEFSGAGENCDITENDCSFNDNTGISIYRSDGSSFRNNTCSSNDFGVTISQSDHNVLSENTVAGNTHGIFISDSSQENAIYENVIRLNGISGINATQNDHITVDATTNWWGSNSGPYHSVNNTKGLGDTVSDFVLFDPWIGKGENSRPIVEIVSVDPAEPIDGDEITITVRGNDDGTIVRYVWRKDDKELQNGTETSLSITTLPVGPHRIFIIAQDDLGEWSKEVETTFTIRAFNLIPSVTISSPGNDTTVGGIVTINGTASDGDGTVHKVEISLDGETWIHAQGTILWSYAWNTSSIANGEYTIRVRSYDGRDNSDVVSIHLRVEDQGDGGGDGENDDDGDSNYWWLLPILLIIVAVGSYLYVQEKDQKHEREN